MARRTLAGVRPDIGDAARTIVIWGRWWLAPIDPDAIEHAAACILDDPVYRAELEKCAFDRAEEIHDGSLRAELVRCSDLVAHRIGPAPKNCRRQDDEAGGG